MPKTHNILNLNQLKISSFTYRLWPKSRKAALRKTQPWARALVLKNVVL